ncbi:hypothetical protein OROMI_015386 [Orobanche minor]
MGRLGLSLLALLRRFMASPRPTINWLENDPEFRGFVKDQGRSNCWAFACGLAVGARYHLSKRINRGPWVLSGQYLVNNFIRYHPKEIPKDINGNNASDEHDNYLLPTKVALDFIRERGILYESVCPYIGQRDLREQDDRKFPKVYVGGYTDLGCTDQGPAAKEAIYEGIVRGPMVGTITLSNTFGRHTGDGVLRPAVFSSKSEYQPSNEDEDAMDEDSDGAMDKYSDGAMNEDSDGANTSSDEAPVNKNVGFVTHALFKLPNIHDDRNRRLQGQASSNSLKTKSQPRELKRLGITISQKSPVGFALGSKIS